MASPPTLAMPKSRILTKSLSSPRCDEEDVVGLEVAVDDAARVRRAERRRRSAARCGTMRGDRDGLAARRSTLGQRAARRGTPSRSTSSRRAARRSRRCRRCAGCRCVDAAFASCRKRSSDLRVARQVGAQHLDRDLLVDDLVARAVHDAHAAFAEQRLDLVAAVERRADERVASDCAGYASTRHADRRTRLSIDPAAPTSLQSRVARSSACCAAKEPRVPARALRPAL